MFGKIIHISSLNFDSSSIFAVTNCTCGFALSFFRNLLFGLSGNFGFLIALPVPHGATEEEMIQAAKIANAHDFILELPQGYQTNIGDRGGKLSGGQKQRLSIARAILKNPAILVLDEATSALDSASEKLVQEALEKLMQDRTSIVIAHRLSTIQKADKIIVMDKGQIIEQGNHKSLMKLDGAYKALVNLQRL